MRFSIKRTAKFSLLISIVFIFCVWIEIDLSSFSDRNLFYHGRQSKQSADSIQNARDNGKEQKLRYQRSAKSLDTVVRDFGDFLKPKLVKETELNDIHISVKTTRNNHRTRMELLLKTWISMANNQTYIFTDSDDEQLKKRLPANHVINTNCPPNHYRKSLCCKMAVEFDHYIMSGKRWFCHVDDDNYLNVDQLVTLLRRYNHTSDWYLGKPSLTHPIEVMDRANPGQRLAFWFATGGAGFCISRALALKMIPHAGGGRLTRAGEQIRLPDDCTIGYIIELLLQKELTVIPEFHSHLEVLWKIRDLKKQVTFSYAVNRSQADNVVTVPGFSQKDDQTKFCSIHCYLYPLSKDCTEGR